METNSVDFFVSCFNYSPTLNGTLSILSDRIVFVPKAPLMVVKPEFLTMYIKDLVSIEFKKGSIFHPFSRFKLTSSTNDNISVYIPKSSDRPVFIETLLQRRENYYHTMSIETPQLELLGEMPKK